MHTPDLYFEEVGYTRRLLETADDVKDFIESFYDMPFKFYPETGGFVPWANIDISTYVGWIDYQGRNQIATLNFSGDWDIFPGGSLEYLVAVVSGEYRPPGLLDVLGLNGYPLPFYPAYDKW